MSNMDLSDMDQAFDDADPETSGFDPIPDGTYQARVESVELVWSKKQPPKRMLKWCLKILNPPYEGRLVWKYNGIENAKIGWLKGDLGLCGLTLEKLSDLPNRLRDLLDIPMEIRVKNVGDFTNVYFNKRLVFGEEEEATKKDDDLPF